MKSPDDAGPGGRAARPGWPTPPPTAGSSLTAMQRDAAGVRALIAAGADVNVADGDGTTALHWAAYHGDVDLVAALLAAGAKRHAPRRASAR